MPRPLSWSIRHAKNAKRRSRGIERREARAKVIAERKLKSHRSAREQLAWLDKHGYAAVRERAKLAARLYGREPLPELVGTA